MTWVHMLEYAYCDQMITQTYHIGNTVILEKTEFSKIVIGI